MTNSNQSIIPLLDLMNKVPGGTMVIPLILGSIVGTFFPQFLDLGSFTTALFKSSSTALIALLIFATGMQITIRSSGPVLAHTAVILGLKTIIPGIIIVAIGFLTNSNTILGISLISILTIACNSNGGIWLAVAGRYGNATDRGAYIASAVNDGPFFVLLFMGVSGLADIPVSLIIAAVIPLILGMIVGNLDSKWTELLKPTGSIVIPFFSFSLGTGINLFSIVTGGVVGLVLGVIITVITGFMCYLGYKYILRRGTDSGLGFAAGTTAGNAIITPQIVAQADPSLAQYVPTATAQVAAAVLVSAILAPLLASIVIKKQKGLKNEA